jgi:iron complex transport system substrate-binding protein
LQGASRAAQGEARPLLVRVLGVAIAALMGVAVALPATPGLAQSAPTPGGARIVAAGGVVTEILYALGAGARIAGVDATSLHPSEALIDKPNVGYVRALSAEGVLSLKPSHIIAVEGAGPPDVLRLLREAGVPITMVTEEPTEAGVAGRIRAVGAAAGLTEPAVALAARTESGFARLTALRQRLEKPRRVLFVLALREGRPLVGGRNSGADAIIRLAGAVNAATEVEGYKPMSDEAVIASAPDVILMMNRGQHTVSSEALFRTTSFALTPAAQRRALVLMDGLYLLGFGPRTPEAARDLMAAVYPERAIPPLDGAKP